MNKMGFGFLRLPTVEENETKKIDFELTCKLVDSFLEKGGRYFDTAYTYLKGESETMLRETLVKRHPRDSYMIADKLPGYKVKSYEDNEKYFNEMLERCGVDRFDVFMLHWLTAGNYRIAEEMNEFGFMRDVKARGQADRIGFSYHDSPELLDEILTAHPETDCVLIQVNWLDWNSATLQAKQLYDVVTRHGKSVMVMEPVKGGSLAKLPDEVAEKLNAADPDMTPAAWALKFAQSLENVEVVLSGMNTLEQIEENMRDVEPITEAQTAVLMDAAEMLRSTIAVNCTGCGYCVSHCPKKIAIPQYMALYNEYARNPGDGWKMQHVFDSIAKNNGKPSECIACGMCEKNCPQKLHIIETLQKLVKPFE